MAFVGELILLLPRDVVLFGDKFAGDAHVEIFVHVPEAVVNHRVEEFLIAEAEAGARALQQIRAVRHGLHAAGDDDFGFAQSDALRCERDGFQAGAANFVDRHRGDARIETAAQRRLPRGILSEARLHHVAHDGFVDLLGIDTSAAHGFSDDFRAQLRRGKRRESAHEFSDGCADGA